MKKILCGMLAVCMLILATGCNVFSSDIVNQLRPPHLTGDQQEVQQALDEFLDPTAKQQEYTLKYPRRGNYRSAFILKDIDGDNTEEAIAFYSQKQDGFAHINLLRKTDGKWKSVADVEGISSEVSEVEFGDLDADGNIEIFIAWSIYDNRDRQLISYSLQNDSIAKIGSDMICNSFYVGDITASGSDDLLLLRNNSVRSHTTAQLKSIRNGKFIDLGTTKLDGFIQGFGNVQLGKLTDGIHGVYIDCVKETSAVITELLYWDGQQLVAPFYNSSTNTSPTTQRDSNIPSMDIDNDGEIEWPLSTRLPGYETERAQDSQWLTCWLSWNYTLQKVQREFYCIMNIDDHYYFRLDNSWVSEKNGVVTTQITAAYNSAKRTLTLSTMDTNHEKNEFLQIKTTLIGEQQNDDETEDRKFEELRKPQNKYITHKVWYDPTYFNLDLEIIQYNLFYLP